MAVSQNNDKALVASSEFDPSAFIKGIDAMTMSLEKLSGEEDKLRQDLANINAALKTNRAEYKTTTDQIKALDQTSKTYTEDLGRLTTQQTNLKNQQKDLRVSLGTNKDALAEVNKKANEFRAALVGINAVSKQVAAENKGRTLFDVASLNQQVIQITAAGTKLRNVFQGKISTAELDKFEAALAETKDEFKQLDQVITFVKSKLDTLDPNSEEFAELNQIVQVGESVLQQYGETAEQTSEKTVSLRTQLRVLREEMSRLEDQGKDNTEEFEQLAVQAGRLQDQMGDTQQRIRVLASDTKNLDFGIGAIRGVASAFGVAEGAAALFGLKNEDVAKSLQRLNAIMLVLNGLQEIQTLLQKQSVVAVVGQEIATKASAAAQRIYAVAVGTSTGALKAFRVALLATGLGAFLALIGLAAAAMGAFSKETKGTTEDIEDFNLELEITNRKLSDAAKDLQFKNKLAIEAARQRGATENEVSQLVIKGYQDEAEASKAAAVQKVKDLTDAVKGFTAGAVIIDPKSIDTIDKAKKALDTVERAKLRISRLPGVTENITEGLTAAVAAAKDIISTFESASDSERLASEESAKFQTKRLEDGRKTAEKEAANYRAFLERLTELQRQLRDKLLEEEPQNEEVIRQQFKNQIADLTEDIDQEVAQKKLTKGQGKLLLNLLGDINTADLNKALKDFNDQVLEQQKEFDKQLFDLRLKSGEQQAELIRDQFTREAAQVRVEARIEAENLKRERDELVKNIEDTPLILPSVKAENIEKIKVVYAQLLENLAAQTTRKQEEISARVFDAAQEQVIKIFSGASLIASKASTEEVLKLADRYQQGKISYEEFQKELTRITKQESAQRIAQSIREQTELLANAQKELTVEKDPGRQKALQDKILQLQLQIEELKKQLAIADAEGTNADDSDIKGRFEELAKYAQAIGNIVSSVVSFWAQANEAEQAALERSIRLQERRVEAATRIAERGNSEYLRLEEDRLNELQTKQENAARRQLAINAVLQTSQALTAFITALAQGIATGGPLGGIAIAGAVIAAIGAGYAIVQGLQSQNTQTLKSGTKSVRRHTEPAGIDTVPAMLTEGEAVLPVAINREYQPAVEAIFDKRIPSDILNNFVQNYPSKEETNFINNYRTNQRVLPVLDHIRMSEAAGIVIKYDAELLNATKEQTRIVAEHAELLKTVDKRLANMGVSVNIDKNGLAVSLMKAIQQFALDKKA